MHHHLGMSRDEQVQQPAICRQFCNPLGIELTSLCNTWLVSKLEIRHQNRLLSTWFITNLFGVQIASKNSCEKSWIQLWPKRDFWESLFTVSLNMSEFQAINWHKFASVNTSAIHLVHFFKVFSAILFGRWSKPCTRSMMCFSFLIWPTEFGTVHDLWG